MKMENCPQSENLVAYLYGEADETEKKAFESHLTSCSMCDEELKAFGTVRESVVEWREDIFNNIVTPAFAREIMAKQERKRSALTAIREFFTLSPMWLRGATAFAAVALIALLVFTAVQLFDKKSGEGVAIDNKENVAPSPTETPKENNIKNEDEQFAKDENTENNPVDDSKEENSKADKKPVRINRKPQMASVPKIKSPGNVNKKQRLSDEEIVGYQMAYYEENDSLRLSSINP